jgi:hypothetical protein
MDMRANGACKAGESIWEACAAVTMTVRWEDAAPCSLVDNGPTFQSKLWPGDGVGQYIYQTTQRNIPEDSHLRNRRRENLKTHICKFLRIGVLSDIFPLLFYPPSIDFINLRNLTSLFHKCSYLAVSFNVKIL